MRKREAFRRLAALICTALTVCASGGCGSKSETVQTSTDIPSSTQTAQTNAAATQSTEDTPVFMLERLPEIGGYVDDIIYKRRYNEKKETLTPGGDYGRLIPFVGSFRDYHLVDYETGEWEDETYSVSKFGLMNDKGEIIVDAVYDWYNICYTKNGDYIIELSVSEDEDEYESIGKKLYCDSLGTWVKETENDIYYNFNDYDDGYIIATDNSEIDWENSEGAPKTVVYDTKWNKIFEVESSCPTYEKVYSDGYFVLEIFTDYMTWECKTQFVDKKGNIVFEDIHPTDYILNGKTSAKKDGGLYGIFDVSGKWAVQPTFSDLRRNSGYYIGKNFWGTSVYNSNGEFVKSVNGDHKDNYIGVCGDRIYIEKDTYYDETTNRSYYQYTDFETEKIITCAETGLPVTQRFEDTEYFYCDYGGYTYIVNFEGRTVAKIPGCGNLWKIDDNYFRIIEGCWEDDTQKYTVFSFRTFEKVWSDTIVNKGDTVDIWDYDGKYIIKEYRSEDEIYSDFPTNRKFEIIDIATGKPLIKDLSDYIIISIGESTYLSVSDGTYTCTYAPDMTLLMKVRNENDD